MRGALRCGPCPAAVTSTVGTALVVCRQRENERAHGSWADFVETGVDRRDNVASPAIAGAKECVGGVYGTLNACGIGRICVNN